MMIAITGAVMLIDRQLAGTLSSLLLFLFPLPMVFYSAKYGMKDSWMVFAALLALLFMIGTPQSIFFVGCESLIGLIYGSGIHAGTDNRRILLRTVVLAGLVELFAMVIFASFFGYDITEEMKMYSDMMEQVSASTGAALPESMTTSSFIKTLFVMSAILTGVLEGVITHLTSRMMLKRLRMPLPPSSPISEYYPPKWTGYVALALMVGYYYATVHPFEQELWQTAAQAIGTAGMLYLIAFGAIGMLVIIPRVNPGLARWTPLIILVLFLFVSLSVSVIGFLYITTDLHERVCRRKDYASEDR